MIMIAEVPEYIRQAEKILTEAERQDVMNYLAAHLKAGYLLLPQRVNAALFANAVRQEQAG